jgi:hypothetical protein
MAESRECEECGERIDTGYIDVKLVLDGFKGLQRSVRLHSNGGCLEKYRLKSPQPPRSTIVE